jgi:hypothetical protein
LVEGIFVSPALTNLILAAVVFEQYNYFIFFVVSALTVLEPFAGIILSGPCIPLQRKVIERITFHFVFK